MLLTVHAVFNGLENIWGNCEGNKKFKVID